MLLISPCIPFFPLSRYILRVPTGCTNQVVNISYRMYSYIYSHLIVLCLTHTIYHCLTIFGSKPTPNRVKQLSKGRGFIPRISNYLCDHLDSPWCLSSIHGILEKKHQKGSMWLSVCGAVLTSAWIVFLQPVFSLHPTYILKSQVIYISVQYFPHYIMHHATLLF